MIDDQTPTGALTEQDRRVVLSRVPLAQGRDDDEIVACVEAIVARHVATSYRLCVEAQRERDKLRDDRANQVWQKRAEKAEAALAEAEQKGAREALLDDGGRAALGLALMKDHGCIHHAGPNATWSPCRACNRRVDLVHDWLRDRAAQIGGESDV